MRIDSGKEVECFLFDAAVHYFKFVILRYFCVNFDIFHNEYLPFSARAFIDDMNNKGTVSAGDIAKFEQLGNLLKSFSYRSLNESKDHALKNLQENISYAGRNEELNEKLSFYALKSAEEIKAEIVHDGAERTFLSTNAFIFDDDSKTYYFDSHQQFVCSDDSDLLGKSSDLNLRLYSIDDEQNRGELGE